MPTPTELYKSAEKLARLLEERDVKIVFAESCTGGLLSAALTRIPGISRYLCGSAVAYQVETKSAWLGISQRLLKNPGPVSVEVARAMAEGALANTPHADIAASVTGYLGPESPEGKDGLVYSAVSMRVEASTRKPFVTEVREHLLAGVSGKQTSATITRLRRDRQIAAAMRVYSQITEILQKQ